MSSADSDTDEDPSHTLALLAHEANLRDLATADAACDTANQHRAIARAKTTATLRQIQRTRPTPPTAPHQSNASRRPSIRSESSLSTTTHHSAIVPPAQPTDRSLSPLSPGDLVRSAAARSRNFPLGHIAYVHRTHRSNVYIGDTPTGPSRSSFVKRTSVERLPDQPPRPTILTATRLNPIPFPSGRVRIIDPGHPSFGRSGTIVDSQRTPLSTEVTLDDPPAPFIRSNDHPDADIIQYTGLEALPAAASSHRTV